MKYLKITICLIIAPFLLQSQDSTKVLRHEIGFNSIGIINMFVNNTENVSLNQLPYLVYYNFYFNKTVCLRVGLGASSYREEVNLEGQIEPRTSDNSALNMRVGVSNDFVQFKRLSLNAFVDGITGLANFHSANTQTMNSFPSTRTITVTNNDRTQGFGAQIGVGVKFNLYKHLSIYTEVPFSAMFEVVTTENTVNEIGKTFDTTTNTTNSSTTQITLPATIYLVLRF